jgi:type I restriction enzyme, S subunit
MSELPTKWATVSVKDIFEMFSGGTPSKSDPSLWNGPIPWLSSGDIKADVISRGSDSISTRALENSSTKLCRPGSILVVVRSGILKHTLPVAVLSAEAAINQDIKCLDSGHDDLNGWLAISLRANARKLLSSNREGTTVQSVKSETLNDFELPVPPLAEQRRIVAKLDALLARVRSSQQRLEGVQKTLRRFRQAVLAAGCSGRLTADWRSKTVDKGIEDLPAGWRAVCVGDVIEDLKYGTAQKCSHEKRGTPVLRIPNVANGIIDLSELKYAVLPPKERETLQLVPGDILIIRSNGSVSLVGRCALVRTEDKGFAYAGYLIRIRPSQAAIAPRFLNLVLGSYNVRLQIELEARSTSGVNNINSEEVRELHFLLPPLEEQAVIVHRTEAMFALADRLENRLKKATSQVERLTQSILDKAFRGELVPTEAELAEAEGRTFESAEQLLQSIQRNGKDVGSKTRRQQPPARVRKG